ncbi:hypothetical protein KJ781_00670 [Patescibacteria group bacterium]|nr:hypothetical protein [Patescibacteria group bacterium]MBU1449008.1 hypothetical protein [Patescibacteria group bacterium]MBU2612850.1 hypothetical protein [Patescibacteria group bacterium]
MASNKTVSTATVSNPRPFTGESVRRLLASEMKKRVSRAKAIGLDEPEQEGLRGATTFVAGIVLRDYAKAKNFESLMGATLLFLVATFKARGMEQEVAKARAMLCLAEVEERFAPKPQTKPERPKFSVERVSGMVAKASDPEGQARWLIGKVRNDANYSPEEKTAIESEIRVVVTARLVKEGASLSSAQQAAEHATATPKSRRMPSADERRRQPPRPAPSATT